VTGATGFIGAHVVDNLLSRGIKVRGTARSARKAEQMLAARAKYSSQLDFVYIEDIGKLGAFDEAVKDVDAVIHVASPLNYSVTDKEKELVLPAINGVRYLFQAAAKNAAIKRIVLTSSFGAVLDVSRTTPYTYTAGDWNPITFEKTVDPKSPAQEAYKGSKKFAELEAWRFVKEEKPPFDLVTICPSMVFGPVANAVTRVQNLGESNSLLWRVASGADALPPYKFPFWIDVRDLAEVHVQALLKPEAGGKRYLPIPPEKFSYQKASEIMLEEFPWAKGRVTTGSQTIMESTHVDGGPALHELGIHYRSFRETVKDFVTQVEVLDR